MKHRLIITSLALLFLSWGCRPDPKVAQWDTEALIPLANSRLEITDIVADSNLTQDQDGLFSLVFSSELAQMQPDEIIEPLNAEFVNSIYLQSIDLGNPKVNDNISLGELCKGGSPAGQFIIHNNGNTAVVPPFPNLGPKGFPVDATDIFQTISLIDGDLELTLDNQLPVPLTNIQFQLENQNSGSVILQSNIDTIKPQQSITRNFSLANTTIEGQLKAILQNFSSPGSDGQTVQIDTSEKVFISISLKNLVPSSATAIFPDQVLAKDTADTDELRAGNAELTSILVDQGQIYLDATSTIEDIIQLDYLIPSAVQNSQQLSFFETIPAAPPNGSSNAYKEVDVSGYQVDLTGRPDDMGVYNRFYTILSSRIDSSGRLINLSLQDSVVLKTGILNMTASRGYGYLGKDTIDVTENNTIETFNAIDSGNFDLAEARLGISVENYIGAPIDLRLNLMQSQAGSNIKLLNWTQLGQRITVPSATLNEPKPIAGYKEIELDQTNSNLDELLEIKPDSLLTSISAFINGSSSGPDYNQFIFSEHGVRSSLFMEVPLHLSASGLRFNDTSEFKYSALDPDNQLQKGELKLIANNYFPVEAQVDLVLLDKKGDKIGRLQSADKVKAASRNSEGRAAQATKSVVGYPLNTQSIDLLRNTANILFEVSLTTPVPPDKVKLYSDNYMDLTLTGDLSIRTR